jgi:hypothetical protein
MMTAEPKQVVRRVIEEVITGGRLDLIEDLFTDREAARARAWITPFRQAFPDVRMEIVELVAEGEIVVGRFRCSATHLGKWGDRDRAPLRGRGRGLLLHRHGRTGGADVGPRGHARAKAPARPRLAIVAG